MSDRERLLVNNEQEVSSYERLVRPVLAEMGGVTLFVFVGCCALVSGDLVGAAIGHGFTIALLIIGLGEISGGHFNPAVTLGVAISGAITPGLAVLYFFGQITGGILGAAIVRGVLPSIIYKRISGGTHQLGAFPDDEGKGLVSVEPGWGLLIEVMLTCVLVFTVLMAAVNNKTKSNLAPLAIGFAVTVDIMAGGVLTGASMNPARAFGPAVCASAVFDDAWKNHWIYWLGPAVGSVIAAFLYKFLFTSSSQRWVARHESM